MSRLALGTAQFGLAYGVANQTGQVPRDEVKSMLQIAAANNIDIIDTAIAYGESEACLGYVSVKNFKVVTKLPTIPDGCLDIGGWVSNQLNDSLFRLGIGNIYGLLLHRSEQLLGKNGPELYQALNLLKKEGLVNKIGVSIYSPCELELLMTDYSFDLVQAPFNLIDQRLFNTGWIKRLKDAGVEIHTRSAFLQGLLLMRKNEMPSKFLPWIQLWKDWYNWLDENKISALQASLAFPLSFSEIDRVVVGADSQSQLLQILSVANDLINVDLPHLESKDENLINPANWPKL